MSIAIISLFKDALLEINFINIKVRDPPKFSEGDRARG